MGITIKELRVEFTASTAKVKAATARGMANIQTFAVDAQRAVGRVVKSVGRIGTGFKSAAAAAASSMRTALCGVAGAASRIGATLKSAATVVTGVVSTAVTGIVCVSNRFAVAGDNIAKTAKRIGMSAEDVSAFEFAAERSGVSLDAMTSGLGAFARYTEEAAQGVKENGALFDRLGVRITEADGKLRPMRELFLDTAQAISKMGSGSDKLSLAQRLFGQGGAALLPMIREGRIGIISLMTEAKRLGGVWTSEQAAAAEKYQDALANLKTAWDGLIRDVIMRNAPQMTAVMDGMTQWAVTHGQFVINKVWIAWEAIREKIGELWDTFTELGRSGELDKWLSHIQVAFIGIVGAIELTYRSMKLVVEGLKHFAHRIVHFNKVAKGEEQADEARASARRAEIYADIVHGGMTYDDLLQMKDQESIDILVKHNSWYQRQERLGKDTSWEAFKKEAENTLDIELGNSEAFWEDGKRIFDQLGKPEEAAADIVSSFSKMLDRIEDAVKPGNFFKTIFGKGEPGPLSEPPEISPELPTLLPSRPTLWIEPEIDNQALRKELKSALQILRSALDNALEGAETWRRKAEDAATKAKSIDPKSGPYMKQEYRRNAAGKLIPRFGVTAYRGEEQKTALNREARRAERKARQAKKLAAKFRKKLESVNANPMLKVANATKLLSMNMEQAMAKIDELSKKLTELKAPIAASKRQGTAVAGSCVSTPPSLPVRRSKKTNRQFVGPRRPYSDMTPEESSAYYARYMPKAAPTEAERQAALDKHGPRRITEEERAAALTKYGPMSESSPEARDALLSRLMPQRRTAGDAANLTNQLLPRRQTTPTTAATQEFGRAGKDIKIEGGNMNVTFNWPAMTPELVREKVWPVIKQMFKNGQEKPLNMANQR